MLTWQYAVTTVPQRWNTTLLDTIRTLDAAGFKDPLVCVDGTIGELKSVARSIGNGPDTRFIVERAEASDIFPAVDDFFPVKVVTRSERHGAFGNWLLTAWELYIADPKADRYCIFQDDIKVCRGLREYLSGTNFVYAYLNAVCYPDATTPDTKRGWHRSRSELGLGAQALIFCNDGFRALLRSPYMAQHLRTIGGHQGIDGVVKSIMQHAGFMELVHTPSLVAHQVGHLSAIDPNRKPQPEAVRFPGEDFDAMSLLKESAA